MKIIFLNINSFVSIAELAQLSLVALISILAYRSVKLLEIKALYWVSLAFICNFLYISFTFISDDKSPLYPLIDYDTSNFRKIGIIFNLITSFCFYVSFIVWFSNREDLSTHTKKARRWFVKKIKFFFIPSKVYAFVLLILMTVAVIYFVFRVNFNSNYQVMDWVISIYDLGGLLCVLLLMRWNSDNYNATIYLTIGFSLWALLQLIVFFEGNINPTTVQAIGFSSSLLAKLAILLGIFLWCVDFTRVSERALERSKQEIEQYEKSTLYLKEILSKTFHEITIPLKNLGSSINIISKSIPRESRLTLEVIERNYERVKAIITVSKYSFNQKGNYVEDIEEIYSEMIPEKKIKSVNTLIEIACRSIQNLYKRVTFIHQYGVNCLIECSQSEIIQVFINLFKNSIEAYDEEERKKILISSYVDKERNANNIKYVTVEVEDYGSGIPQDIIDQIWQLGFSTKKIDDNNIVRGQGLHIIKEIIDKYPNSSIEIESPLKRGEKNSIKGTKFILRFQQSELPKSKTNLYDVI